MIVRKKFWTIVLVIATSFMLAACGEEYIGLSADYYITDENVDAVCEVLSDAGLSNIDVFRQWVMESHVNSDIESTDEDQNRITDADCRMTVMLLTGDSIKYDSVEEDYKGNYLMYDIDAIENDDRYTILKDKEKLFTTLFGEEPVREEDAFDVIPMRWERHGIKMGSDKYSVITIHFTTLEGTETFVGHTGLLVDCRDNDNYDTDYIFVEKIAFGDPFYVTPIKDENELMEIFSARPDYSVLEGEPRPLVYKNGELLGELLQIDS